MLNIVALLYQTFNTINEWNKLNFVQLFQVFLMNTFIMFNNVSTEYFCVYLTAGELYYSRYKDTSRAFWTKVVCAAEEANNIFVVFHASKKLEMQSQKDFIGQG